MKAAVAVGFFLTGHLFSTLVVPSGLEPSAQTFGANFGDSAVVVYVPGDEPQPAEAPVFVEPATPVGEAPALSDAGYRTL
jgi:hypothetical protein